MTHGAYVLSKYVTDQVQEDAKRDERVEEGSITRDEADVEADEWAEVSHQECVYYISIIMFSQTFLIPVTYPPVKLRTNGTNEWRRFFRL